MSKSSDPGRPQLLAEGSLLGALGAPAPLKALGSAPLQRSLPSARSSVLRGDPDSCSHPVLPHAHHLSSSPARGPGGSSGLARVALALFPLTGSQAPLQLPGKKHLGPDNARQPSLTRPSAQVDTPTVGPRMNTALQNAQPYASALTGDGKPGSWPDTDPAQCSQ